MAVVLCEKRKTIREIDILIKFGIHDVSGDLEKLFFFFFLKKWLLDIFQQFTFVIKYKKKHTDLNINNNTNRCDKQTQ